MSHQPAKITCHCVLVAGYCTRICAVTPHEEGWTEEQWQRAHDANAEALPPESCTGC